MNFDFSKIQHTAHLCALMDLSDPQRPKLVRWDIYSEGPMSLTTMARGHAYLEYMRASAPSFHEAAEQCARWVAEHGLGHFPIDFTVECRERVKGEP